MESCLSNGCTLQNKGWGTRLVGEAGEVVAAAFLALLVFHHNLGDRVGVALSLGAGAELVLFAVLVYLARGPLVGLDGRLAKRVVGLVTIHVSGGGPVLGLYS